MINNVESHILYTVAEQFGLSEVHPSDRFVQDLHGDALDTIELVMRLEEDFDIEISDEAVANIVTIQDAIDCVTRISQPA